MTIESASITSQASIERRRVRGQPFEPRPAEPYATYRDFYFDGDVRRHDVTGGPPDREGELWVHVSKDEQGLNIQVQIHVGVDMGDVLGLVWKPTILGEPRNLFTGRPIDPIYD